MNTSHQNAGSSRDIADLHDIAIRHAHELRAQAVDELWRAAIGTCGRILSSIRGSVHRLTGRLFRQPQKRSA